MPSITYDSFYKYGEWTGFLKQIKAEHEHFVEIISLTETREQRQVLLAAVTDPSTGAADTKPAYYIQAGLHAIEGAGVTAALHVLHAVLTEDRYRPLLKRIAFYIVPCVDPDGLEHALTKHAEIRSRYGSNYRKNELVPQDVNGDGYILQMRWKDTAGLFREHPEEPRLMVRREAGDEDGPFYQLVQEGRIAEYDSSIPVRPMRRVDFNRSYPVNWAPNPNSTEYPLSAPEMRAVADFMISHPNIFAGIDFHCGTHAILRTKYKAEREFHPEDLKSLNEIGKLAEQITGFPYMSFENYSYGGVANAAKGDSNDWAYAMLGISHYVIEVGYGFTSLGLKPAEILSSDEKTREDYVRRLLQFHDDRQSQIFKPWEPFDHPELGPVEVGGMMVGNARFMYPPDMKDVVPNTTAFIMEHAARHPKLILANTEATRLEGRLYRIRSVVCNIGGFSTDVMKGGGSVDVKRAVEVTLAADDIETLSRSSVHEANGLDALGGALAVEWFIRAGDGTKELILEASHPRAGTVREIVQLLEQ